MEQTDQLQDDRDARLRNKRTAVGTQDAKAEDAVPFSNNVTRHRMVAQGQPIEPCDVSIQNSVYQVELSKKQEERISEHEGSRLSANVRKKSGKFSICSSECPLCLQSINESQFVNFTKCFHKFCVKCCMQLIREELENFERVQCPEKGCGAFLDCQTALLEYLDDQEFKKLCQIQNVQCLRRSQRDEDQIQLSVGENALHEDEGEHNVEESKKNNRPVGKDEKQILVSMMSSKVEKSPQKFNPGASSDSQMYVSDSGIESKEHELRKSRFCNPSMSGVNSGENEPTFPRKIFSFLCSEVWLNDWSRFIKILPISLLLIFLGILVLCLWSLWVFAYFVLVWVIFVPATWAIFEIWGCFNRSFKRVWLRNVLFALCVCGFPLLFCFFYFLTLGIVLFDALFRADMQQVVEGKIPLVISCRKVHLYRTRLMDQRCSCKMGQKCRDCQNKSSIFCLVL